MALTAIRRGVVAEFDAAVGLGSVRADDGAVYDFHCTAIADGSRDVEPGTKVSFLVVPGRGGRWEATRLTGG